MILCWYNLAFLNKELDTTFVCFLNTKFHKVDLDALNGFNNRIYNILCCLVAVLQLIKHIRGSLKLPFDYCVGKIIKTRSFLNLAQIKLFQSNQIVRHLGLLLLDCKCEAVLLVVVNVYWVTVTLVDQVLHNLYVSTFCCHVDGLAS